MADEQLSQSEKVALRERIKELTCLYGIAQIARQSDKSGEDILKGIINLLPAAWQYPEITHARITLDGLSYTTPGFRDGFENQTADIVIGGKVRGAVEIAYTEEKLELYEGPFLEEERNLIDAVARQIALIIEQKQAEEDKLRLYDQLRHADRLATIGILAAGVAHELNEPLGNILGFAQLVKKCAGLPTVAKQDIDKIESASLQAREIIRKLLVFARQMPPKKSRVNLNSVVEDGLYFFESRCAKGGVEIIRELCANLPEITADPAQLNQLLVNLVVNALQSTPGEGKITVKTQFCDPYVLLTVEDTGMGMSEEVLQQIFIPFFTTKDVGSGTGLGLPVVHGIVIAHGGSIEVKSEVGCGSRFEIRIPVVEPQDVEEES